MSQISPNARAYPGGPTYYASFISGTYPFDPSDSLTLTVISAQNDSPVLQFEGIAGRTYTVLGSADLRSWGAVSFQLPSDGPSAPVRPNIYAQGVQTLQVQVLQPASGPMMRFFKLMVQ